MNDQILQQLSDRLSDTSLDETILPDGSGVLLDISGHRVLTLSRTAVFLVERIRRGAISEQTLASELQSRFNIDQHTAYNDTNDFIAALAATFDIEAE